jgi:DNA repair protein RadC
MRTVKKLELRSRRVPVAADSRGDYETPVSGPRDAASIAAALLEGEEQEVFLAFPLDIKNRVLGYVEVARGSIDSVGVDPRMVFRTAVLLGASAVIVVHNHPSGDPTPSAEDVALTERLVDAGRILGIPVLDHVIVAGERTMSFAEKQMLRGSGR